MLCFQKEAFDDVDSLKEFLIVEKLILKKMSEYFQNVNNVYLNATSCMMYTNTRMKED